MPKFLWGTLQWFIKTWSSKNFMHKIGVFHDFPWKTFCLTVPKNFAGTLVFRKSSGIQKILDNKLSRFCRDFLSHGAEIFVGLHWLIQKGHPKFYAWKRSSTIFRGKNLVSQYRKTSWGTLLCSKIFLVRKKFMDKKGDVTFFRWSLFAPKATKTSWVSHSVFQKCSGIKSF